MTMTTEQQAREEMVRLGASFFQRGYATGSAGNLSLLLPDGTLLATPTGSCLGELQAERLSKVSLNGEWLSGDKPSKEISFHRALYLNNPECKAVVHLHCTYLTALSCLQGLDVENAIKPFTPYVVMRRQGAGGAVLPPR
jgi:3-dehydro-4-phosphotetronate decarboxylase